MFLDRDTQGDHGVSIARGSPRAPSLANPNTTQNQPRAYDSHVAKRGDFPKVILSGTLVPVSPSVAASLDRDSGDR
jgi:hypothetical protein